MRKLFVLVALSLAVAPTAPTAHAPAFEVATVKANKSGAAIGSLRRVPGGQLNAVTLPLRTLTTFAYQLQPFQLVGAPAWTATERFDIVAKIEGDPTPRLPGSG